MTQQRNVRIIVLLGSFAALGLSTTAEARSKRAQKHSVSRANAGPNTTPINKKGVAKKVKNYTFLSDEVQGDRLSPGGFSISAIAGARHGSLLHLRTEFIGKILMSAEML